MAVQIAQTKVALCAATRLNFRDNHEILCAELMPKKPQAKKLTREDRRNLDVEIGFIEGVVRRDPGYIDALQILGDDYTRRGRFADGLTVDEQLARLRPHDSTVLYNLACSYSLTDRIVEAFSALHRA